MQVEEFLRSHGGEGVSLDGKGCKVFEEASVLMLAPVFVLWFSIHQLDHTSYRVIISADLVDFLEYGFAYPACFEAGVEVIGEEMVVFGALGDTN